MVSSTNSWSNSLRVTRWPHKSKDPAPISTTSQDAYDDGLGFCSLATGLRTCGRNGDCDDRAPLWLGSATVDKRRIGSLEVTVVGLGTNNFGSRLDAERTADVVAAALDSGINFFDTADIYGNTLSEVYLGAALGERRDEAIIATKFGVRLNSDEAAGASPRWIATAVEDSLRRLDTDRIDLYQLHEPDLDTPIEDTLEALDRLVLAGKVREIGCSNFEASAIDGSMDISDTRGIAAWSSVQNRYSMLHRTPETDRVLDACSRHGIALLPYFPSSRAFSPASTRPVPRRPRARGLLTMGLRTERGSSPRVSSERWRPCGISPSSVAEPSSNWLFLGC